MPARAGPFHRDLDSVRLFRNRIAHHEPIYKRHLAKDHDTIMRLIAAVSPETAEFARQRDRVPAVLARRLGDTGRADPSAIEAELALHILGWLGARLPPKRLVAAVTALVCLRHLDEELLDLSGESAASDDAGHAGRQSIARLRRRAAEADPDDLLVRSEVEALDDDSGWLPAVVDDLVEAAWGCREAFERVLAARERLGVADLYVDAVAPELARLAAGLSGAQERADEVGVIRVADPAVGAGDLLVAVLNQLAEDAAPEFTGSESEPFLARIARRRLAVYGVPISDVEIQCHEDAVDQSVTDFDSLVTCLPYASKEDRDEENPLARMRELADRLDPGQTAVVIGPADVLVGALGRFPATAQTRESC
jgi:hypothetical protein